MHRHPSSLNAMPCRAGASFLLFSWASVSDCLQMWTGETFEQRPLRALGLRVQLGHEDGSQCFVPVSAHEQFVIVHDNALHEAAVDFCGCVNQQPARLQLLRAGMFPSTVMRPRTAVTFKSLEQFDALTLTGKLSAYDYYKHLVYRTDAAGLCIPKVGTSACSLGQCMY